jgi:hypothetical protein
MASHMDENRPVAGHFLLMGSTTRTKHSGGIHDEEVNQSN